MSLDLQYAILAVLAAVVFGGVYLWLRREGRAIDADRTAARQGRAAGE